MAKRVYWESLKKWARENPGKAGTSSGGVLLAGVLIAFLVASGSIDILGFTGNVYCAGQSWGEDDPCIAEVNMTLLDDVFVYQTDYDPYGRNTVFSFEPAVRDFRIGRDWGDGIRWYRLDEPCKGTWCGASPGTIPTNKSFAFAWRKGTTRTVYVQILKFNEDDTIKWSFGLPGEDSLVDPAFLPPNTAVKVGKKKTKTFLLEKVQKCRTTFYNETVITYPMLKYFALNGSYQEKEVKNTSIVPRSFTSCEDTGRSNVIITEQDNRTFLCDYSSWGACDEEDGVLACDSKMDGNADGKCDPGESCIRIDLAGARHLEEKDAYSGLDKYGVDCIEVKE